MSDARARERIHLTCVAVLLGVLPWAVAPGLTQPDTKLDLVLSPARYLGRALDAWNTHTGLGEIQNQAYGYLLPMGPVHLLGRLAGMPGWATQRLWWTLVLVVALLGAHLALRRIAGLGPWAALIGALSYALAPRVLTVLSEISVEAWPGALAPWLVLAAAPLVAGERRRRSGLAAFAGTAALTGLLGGVNATASAVALALPFLLLLTAPRGSGRPRALAVWVGGVVVGGSWWVAPLLVLGRYGYPFLDYIESASTTTAVASLSNVLRGASHWVAWILTPSDTPTWQSGWVLAQYVAAILGTGVLAAVGVAGLVAGRARWGHAGRWAAVSLVVGVVAMTSARVGTADGVLAGAAQSLLDGVLSPLRNVHKADPLVRLPLAIGLGLAVQRLATVGRPAWRRAGLAATVLALVGATLPVWLGRVGDSGAYASVPREWRELAAVVDGDAAGTTLLLPAARFASYDWGTTNDEPLSALAETPVLVRAAAPLGPPGATRLLDEVDRLATSGVGQRGLAPALLRLGVGRVVVRGGLTPDAGADRADLVEQTLERSAGLTPEATFGSGPDALRLWRVTGEPLGTAEDRLEVSGGSEALPALAATGLLTANAFAHFGSVATATVVTDTLRLRAFNAGRPTALAYGPTTTLDDPAVGPGTRPDLAVAAPPTDRPHRAWVGVDHVTVSSSAADPFSALPGGPATGPAAALDGDAATAWLAGDDGPEQWLTLAWDAPTVLGTLDVGISAPATGTAPVRSVEVVVDGRGTSLAVADDRARLALGDHAVRRVQLIVRGSPAEGERLGLAEVTASARTLGSTIAVPAGHPTRAVLLSRDPLSRPADGREGEDGATWDRRVIGWPGGAVAVTATLRPRPGPALDAWLDGALTVSGSRADADPAHRPGAALDGDATTRWRPGAGQATPSLDLATRTGTPLGVLGLPDGDRAVRVAVAVPGGRLLVLVPGSSVEVPTPSARLTWFGLAPGAAPPDVTVAGARLLDSPLSADCATGPTVTVDGRTTRIRATVAVRSVLTGAPVAGSVCTDGAVAGPTTDVRATASDLWSVESLVLRRPGSLPTTAGPVSALVQGANAGWRLPGAGPGLTVDGWRQGWLLPVDTTSASFGPATAYRASILGGLALWAAAALLALALLLLDHRRRSRTSPPIESARTSADARSTRRFVHSRSGAQPGRAGSDPTWRWPVATALAVLVALLVAGWVGGLVAAAVALLPARHRWVAALAGMSGAAVALTALGAAEAFSAGALAGQALATVSLAALVLALGSPRAPGRGPVARRTARTAPRDRP